MVCYSVVSSINSVIKNFCKKVVFIACSATTFGDEGKVMSVHGKISQFIPSQESWSSYTERLEYYFIANDVQDLAKKKAILLTVCGPSTFQLLKNLLQPIKKHYTHHLFR